MNDRALRRALEYLPAWLELRLVNEDMVGMSVAVAHKGKILFNKAYGYSNVENRQKLTPNHLFRIASHSKTFTATAIMQLQEQGKLKIDSPVMHYLPWLKEHHDKRFELITVRQLMSHSAGVIRDGEANNFWQLLAPFPDYKIFQADILKHGLVIENNTKMKYSNYGYTLLGMIIEAVSGQTYHEFVIENIVKPLGLRNTGPETTKEAEQRLITAYTRADYAGKKHLPIDNVPTNAMAAATGFYSNAEDLCKYFSAHISGSGKLLNDESKKEMQRTQWTVENTGEKNEYGLGLDIEYVNKHRLVGHGGGFPGNVTKSFCDPKNELVVIVLTNANGSWPGYIGKNIIKVIDYFQENWQGGNSAWRKYEGEYTNLWWHNEIVALKDKLVISNVTAWEPFDNVEELTYISSNEFEVSKCDGYSSYGEKVQFVMGGNKVKNILYAGGTMWPTAEFIKNTTNEGRIRAQY